MPAAHLLLAVWAAGGLLLVLALLLEAGGWHQFVEDLRADGTGYPLLDPTEAAALLVLLILAFWPLLLLHLCLTRFR